MAHAPQAKTKRPPHGPWEAPAARLPQFEQRDLDLIGLALVAVAVFFSFVFYLGWDGGKVGEALADGLIFLFGGVAT